MCVCVCGYGLVFVCLVIHVEIKTKPIYTRAKSKIRFFKLVWFGLMLYFHCFFLCVILFVQPRIRAVCVCVYVGEVMRFLKSLRICFSPSFQTLKSTEYFELVFGLKIECTLHCIFMSTCIELNVFDGTHWIQLM